MPSPLCTVNAGATTNGVDVAPNSTVTIALASTAGVGPWSLTCISTDETQDAPTITASLSINQTTKTATFTMPNSLGVALRFKSVVGKQTAGLTDGIADASLTTTFEVHTLVGGLRVGAFDEQTECGAFGHLSKFNAAIRNVGGLIAQPTSGGSVFIWWPLGDSISAGFGADKPAAFGFEAQAHRALSSRRGDVCSIGSLQFRDWSVTSADAHG